MNDRESLIASLRRWADARDRRYAQDHQHGAHGKTGTARLREAADTLELSRDALIRVGGLKADGTQGFHMVGDEKHPDECPGCWAWWGLFGTARPTQDQLDALDADYANAAEAGLV